MLKKSTLLVAMMSCFLAMPVFAQDEETETEKLVKQLQAVSVTVKAGSGRWAGEGSGVIVTRTLKDKNGKDHNVNFVWTAGHVIDNLRTVREVIDPKTGTTRKIIEFKPPQIVQELRDETGRRIGEVKLETKVLCYSDADTGEDLALLMVLKRNFVKSSAKFYLGKRTPGMGTYICHVGSRHGQFGANSFSSGRISAVGRTLASVANKLFDQTSVPASPGSSGGGVFIEKGKNKGKCLGLIVRGGESTFNFIVPVRRMHKWAKKMNIAFALDPKVKPPKLEDLKKISIDDGWINRDSSLKDSAPKKPGKHYKTLIKRAKAEKTQKKVSIRKMLYKREEKKETPLDKRDPVDQVKYFKAMSNS